MLFSEIVARDLARAIQRERWQEAEEARKARRARAEPSAPAPLPFPAPSRNDEAVAGDAA